ncbi:uncharacterized protein LOC117182808 isoform X3 [Belonocnema kinseyi]|nr:uncharacterized protein LOC117182808 isoform X3 [Belonocnema kinseyi]
MCSIFSAKCSKYENTEQEIDRLIEAQRPKYPPVRMLVPFDENTDEETPLLPKVPLAAKRK